MNRDEIAPCPRCGAGLDANGTRRVCGQCQGVLVPDSEVRAMIAEAMSFRGPVPEVAADLALETPATAEPSLTCPLCTSAMTKHTLHGIVIDRCVAHGLWFDGEELQHVLNAAGLDDIAKARKVSLAGKLGATLTIGAYIAINVIRFLYF